MGHAIKHGRPFLAAAIALACLGLAVSAAGTIPDAQGIIHACYNPRQAATLRVIDTAKGQACTSNEKPLNWNQRGTRGPPGADGAAVIARLSWTGSQVVTYGGANFTPHLGDWMQGANEIDVLIPGTMTFDVPQECIGTQNHFTFRLYVDTAPLALGGEGDYQYYVSIPGSTAHEVSRIGSPALVDDLTLFEPGVDTSRSADTWITLGNENVCTQGVTVTGFTLDVVAFR